MPLFETADHLERDAEILRRRRYGVIETQAGRLKAVRLRPLPKTVSLVEALWLGGWMHHRLAGDRCWLYYDQPLGHSNFLAVKYIISSRGCTLATFRGALTALDEIARLKNSDAALCDVTNARIDDRFLARLGWQRHLEGSRRRHFIKRFYGSYPHPAAAQALCCAS